MPGRDACYSFHHRKHGLNQLAKIRRNQQSIFNPPPRLNFQLRFFVLPSINCNSLASSVQRAPGELKVNITLAEAFCEVAGAHSWNCVFSFNWLPQNHQNNSHRFEIMTWRWFLAGDRVSPLLWWRERVAEFQLLIITRYCDGWHKESESLCCD